jgi:hypothetical protein
MPDTNVNLRILTHNRLGLYWRSDGRCDRPDNGRSISNSSFATELEHKFMSVTREVGETKLAKGQNALRVVRG